MDRGGGERVGLERVVSVGRFFGALEDVRGF